MNNYFDKLNLTKDTLIFENELLKNHTTFGVGGPAKFIICPKTIEDLIKILNHCNTLKQKLYFLGSGSNILANDNGFNGVIISLKKAMNKIEFLKKEIYVQSGAMLGTLVKNTSSRGYCGMESLIGVPGTLGGALIMNAGAHGSEISELLISARTINKNGEIKKYNKNDISFSYRHSTFPENEILLDAKFKIIIGDKNKIVKTKSANSTIRKNTQPLKYRSAGSIFKNPSKKIAAGFLIEKAGLKGLRIGDAEISKKHANFIINHGNAKFIEIMNLINIIKNKVKEKFMINLELEIKIIG